MFLKTIFIFFVELTYGYLFTCRKHLAELLSKYPQDSQKHRVNRLHNDEFHKWFKDYVSENIITNS